MKKVYIDCGHGGTDSGAIGNGMYEKDIVLAVGKKLDAHLKRCGIETKMSRTTDVYKTLEFRSDDANAWGADVFASLHCNSFNKSAKGLETYCYQFQYKKLAECVHEEVVKAGLYTINRGVKEGNFSVIRRTKMSAFLIELAFIDQPYDAKLLKEKQDAFAVAIAKGICKFLGVAYKEENTSNTGEVLYQVVVGTFKIKENAIDLQKELISKGYTGTFLDAENK